MSVRPPLWNCDGADLPAPTQDGRNRCGRQVSAQSPGGARWVSRWDSLAQGSFKSRLSLVATVHSQQVEVCCCHMPRSWCRGLPLLPLPVTPKEKAKRVKAKVVGDVKGLSLTGLVVTKERHPHGSVQSAIGSPKT